MKDFKGFRKCNSNSNSNKLNVRKKNRSNKKKQVPVNEIYEYEPEQTLPINDLKYIHGMLNENNIQEDTSDSDDMEETPSH